CLMLLPTPPSTLFPYTTLFRSTPVIRRIESVKEEFGYWYWTVETDAGPRRFTVREVQHNVVRLSPEHVLIIDLDGNRYDIPDTGDRKSTRLNSSHVKISYAVFC